jgi:putative intracellular protease/amidase
VVRRRFRRAVGVWLNQPVAEDGNLVTSQAAGTAMALGLTLARRLAGGEISAKLAQDMLATPVA